MSEITSLLDDLKISIKSIEEVLEGVNLTLNKSTQQVNIFTKTIDNIGKISKVTDAMDGIGKVFSKTIQPGEAFNKTLKEIQESTHLTNSEMEHIDLASRELAQRFGTDAADGAKGFKQILTELAPELIKTPEALKSMGENAAVLSKQMGNDQVAASKVLITAMKEYGVSMDDPTQAAQRMTEMMNIMSAASNRSKETLSGIHAAIGEAGANAYKSKISFSELNAAIVLIEQNGTKGAKAGKAIDEVLTSMASSANLSKDAQSVIQKYNVDLSAAADTSKSLEERLAVYGPLVHDQTAMIALFGEANVKSAREMILCRNELAKNAEAITNTNDAYDQSDIKLAGFAGKMDIVRALAKEVSIGISEMIAPFEPFTSVLGSVYGGLKDIMSVAKDVSVIMNSKLGDSIKSVISWGGNLFKFLGSMGLKMGELAVKAIILGSRLINDLGGAMKKAALATWQFIRPIIVSAIQIGYSIIRTTILGAMLLAAYVPSIIAATVSQWGLNIAMLANPLGLIIVGVVAVIGAVVLMVKYWDVIIEKFNAIKDWFLGSNIFGGLLEQFPWIQDGIDFLWGHISSVVELIKGAFEGLGNIFGPVVEFFTGDSKSTSKGSKENAASKKGIGDLFTTTEATPTASGNNTHLPGSKNLTQNAKAITSGGSTGNTYHVNVGKLQDQIVLNVPNINQSKQELERVFGEMMNKLLHSIKTSQV